MKVEIDENIEYTEEIARLQCRYKTTRIRKLAYMIQQFGMQIEVSKEEKTIRYFEFNTEGIWQAVEWLNAISEERKNDEREEDSDN